MFGVDIILDEDYKLFIIEINASPMIVGTAEKKNKILFNLMNGIFNITFAQQFSRVERTLEYINANRKEINQSKNLKKHKKEFKERYKNHVSEKYSNMLSNLTWEKIYDEEIPDKYGKYMGLYEKKCVDMIES